jgi:hypothetical protein
MERNTEETVARTGRRVPGLIGATADYIIRGVIEGAHVVRLADVCASSAAGGFGVIWETWLVVDCDFAVGEVAFS